MSFRSRPRCWRSGSTRSSGGTRSRRSTIRWSSPPDPPSDRNPSALARRTELTGPRASRNTRSIWPTFAIRRLTRRPFETKRSIFWKVDHFIFRRFRAPPPQQLFECFWNPRQLKLDGWNFYSEIVKKISRRCFETKFQVNWIYDVIVMKSDYAFFVFRGQQLQRLQKLQKLQHLRENSAKTFIRKATFGLSAAAWSPFRGGTRQPLSHKNAPRDKF